MESKDIVKAWEERVGRTTAHLQLKEWLTHYIEYLRKTLSDVDFKGKDVLDYACGGGFLRVAFPEIKTYTGVDITDRAIDTAQENVPDGMFIKTTPCNVSMVDKEDIFICLNMIQHLPSKEIFDKFLKDINELNVRQVILNIRAGKKVLFRDRPYHTTKDIGLACIVPAKAVETRLSNFKLTKKKKDGQFEYLYFEAK